LCRRGTSGLLSYYVRWLKAGERGVEAWEIETGRVVTSRERGREGEREREVASGDWWWSEGVRW